MKAKPAYFKIQNQETLWEETDSLERMLAGEKVVKTRHIEVIVRDFSELGYDNVLYIRESIHILTPAYTGVKRGVEFWFYTKNK